MAAKKQPYQKQPVPSVCENPDCSHSGWLKKRRTWWESDESGRRLKAGQSFRLLTDYSVKGARERAPLVSGGHPPGS